MRWCVCIKETYFYVKGLSSTTKETYFYTKETYFYTKETYFYTKETYFYTKETYFYDQKKSTSKTRETDGHIPCGVPSPRSWWQN
jgi:hypothetical protein